MATIPVAHDDLLNKPASLEAQVEASTTSLPTRPPRKRPQKPNYAKIHAKPLPVEVYPLPAFIPQSPLSLLRIAATILKHFFSPPSSHQFAPYEGHFSPESRSVHITDPLHVRALWEMGFFGKGTLSRSEPSWLDREKARLKAGAAGSAEEATRKRREERKLFKLERARAEREQIEQQLKQEKAAMEPATSGAGKSEHLRQSSLSHVFPWQAEVVSEENPLTIDDTADDNLTIPTVSADAQTSAKETEIESLSTLVERQTSMKSVDAKDLDFKPEEPTIDVTQEHLQLTLEEAFFLSYGLGVLQVRGGPSTEPITTKELFNIAWRHSIYPLAKQSQLRPDNPFLLNYAVYHYYRSLGWVVRPGVKFSADYMLYNRGPVFSHAEFAVIIIPEYHPDAPEDERKESRDWWWLHCINRVQSQVRKSLVICYVEVPTLAALQAVDQGDIGAILRQYKVREFVLRRFLANRSRD